MASKRRKCRHCGAVGVSRPRGLCGVCYYIPSIRRVYPQMQRQDHEGYRVPQKMPVPTCVLPGPAKIAVLADRYERGELLHHPRDARHREE